MSANREMVVYCFDTLVAHFNSEDAPPPAFDGGQQYDINPFCFLLHVYIYIYSLYNLCWIPFLLFLLFFFGDFIFLSFFRGG